MQPSESVARFSGAALLLLGSLPSLLSLVTSVASRLAPREGRHASPVYIPVVGPVFCDLGLMQLDAPLWTLPLPWALDLGTLALLAVSPRIAREWWATSRFTRTGSLAGTAGDARATLSMHRGGRYRIEKRWHRPPNEPGFLSTGEVGSIQPEGSDLRLASDFGGERLLRRRGSRESDGYIVEESGAFGERTLDGWILSTPGPGPEPR